MNGEIEKRNREREREREKRQTKRDREKTITFRRTGGTYYTRLATMFDDKSSVQYCDCTTLVVRSAYRCHRGGAGCCVADVKNRLRE